MSRKRRGYQTGYFFKKRIFWVILCVLFACAQMVPYLILGENSIVTYHDQLDGEVLTYILNAKHLFDGVNYYPEMMNGISRNSLVSPAPLFVFLFRLFKPFVAFLICMFIVKVTAAASMFLFIDELTDNKFVAFLMALVFSLLPFYTVYGLCIPGQPLVYYIFLRFKRDRWEWPLYFASVFYAGCSSLVLCGYALLFVLAIFTLVMLIKRIHPLRYILLCASILIAYVAENLSLFGQLFGAGSGFISHKTEMIHKGIPFDRAFLNNALYGADYTKAYQLYFLPMIVIAIAVGGIYVSTTAGEKDNLIKTYRRLVITFGLTLFLIAVISVLETDFFCNIANSSNGLLREFNFTRFSWTLTALWYALFALSVSLIWQMAVNMEWRFFFVSLFFLALTETLGLTTYYAIGNNDLRPNCIKLIKGDDYYMMTWKQFFAEDLFDECERLIGEDRREVNVVSLGIYPAAASYNGFNTLDGYSNNYDVRYKHEFRRVIAPQLDKSQYLSGWFDEWGNRCYLVLAESNNYFTFEKKWTPYTSNYELDFDALKALGCDYIISATYLIDSERYGLRLLNENDTPIESDGSWYRLWVYALN